MPRNSLGFRARDFNAKPGFSNFHLPLRLLLVKLHSATLHHAAKVPKPKTVPEFSGRSPGMSSFFRLIMLTIHAEQQSWSGARLRCIVL